MAAPALPTTWPGATTAPTVRGTAANKSIIAQGVLSGNTTPKTNEVPQVQRGLVWWNPGIASLTRLMSQMKAPRKTSKSYRYTLLEKQPLPRTATIASVTGGATSPSAIKFAANEAYRFRAGDLLRNMTTGDICRVTAISDDDDITCTPNIGDGAPSGDLWVAAQVVMQIGNAQVDGALVGAGVHVVEDEKTFYTQILFDALDTTRRYEDTELFEGNHWTNARKAAEMEHLKSIEYARFLGKASVAADATSGRLLSTMAGLKALINVNVIDMASNTTFTKAFWDSAMGEIMRQGKNGFDNKEMATKTLVASHKMCGVFSSFADSAIRVLEPSQKTYGLAITQYKSPHGILNIINAPVLNQNAGVAALGFVLDLAHIFPIQMGSKGATRFEDNIQDPRYGGEVHAGAYISDVGIGAEVIPAHTAIIGLA